RLGEVFDSVHVLLERGVVDQNGKLAERLDSVRDRLLAEFSILDVAANQQAALALGLNAITGFLRIGVLAQIHDGHVGAFASKQHRHRPPDAGIAAGDERHHAAQFPAAGVGGGQELGPRVEVVLQARFRQLPLGKRRIRMHMVAGLGFFRGRRRGTISLAITRLAFGLRLYVAVLFGGLAGISRFRGHGSSLHRRDDSRYPAICSTPVNSASGRRRLTTHGHANLDSRNTSRRRTVMPEQRTRRAAAKDKKEGKSPSTQAGEYVREEIEHVREGKHGARSTKQAIAIGLSKARRAGIKAPVSKSASKSTKKKAAQDEAA